MRLVCQPTRQQYEKIAEQGRPALKALTRKFALSIRGGNDQQVNPQAVIGEALAGPVREVLSPEQAARYRKELDERAAARKRTVLANLVAKVDRDLVLSAEQRDKLGKVLERHWKDGWDHLQMLFYAGQYYPPMPEQEITPILTEAQKTVWNGISKGNIRFGFNIGIMNGLEIQDEIWDDEPRDKGR